MRLYIYLFITLLFFRAYGNFQHMHDESSCVHYHSQYPDNLEPLVDEIKANSSIKPELVVYNSDNYAVGCETPACVHDPIYYIYLPSPGTPKYNLGCFFCIAALYHEMGHIAHGDIIDSEKIDSGLLTCNQAMDNSFFQSDIDHIEGYKQQSILYLKNNQFHSNSLKYAQNNIHSLSRWKKNEPCVLYACGKEQRADLFAMEKLYEHGRTDVLIAMIRTQIGGSLFMPSTSIHPPGFERALYKIGFLINKGLDIDTLLCEFELKNNIPKIPISTSMYLIQYRHWIASITALSFIAFMFFHCKYY